MNIVYNFKKIFKETFDLKWDSASPEEINQTILSGSKIHGTNMCVLVLAILIASIGLNMNSTAVIIGAMLISPLMGSIMAIGYGLATGDFKLAKNSFAGLFFQVIICIIASTIYFSLSPISTARSEILARTNPTIWDVLIAFTGGLAGIIGITRKEKSNVIPGVAIATALMPPLCTAGYGIAKGQLNFFLGAMYLFFINSFFICISTIIVIKFLNLPKKTIVDEKLSKKLHIQMTILSIIMIIPSIIFAYQIVRDSILESNINNYLNKEFKFNETQVVQSSFNKSEKEIEVALIGKRLSDRTINTLTERLNNYNLNNITLKVTQTEVSTGISAEEIQEIIENQLISSNNSTTSIQTDATEIENLKSEILQYKALLLEYQNNEFDIKSITDELKSLYPQIINCSIGLQKYWNDELQAIEEKVIVIMYLPVHLKTNEHNQVLSWLETKLNKSNIEIFEILSNYPNNVSNGSSLVNNPIISPSSIISNQN